MIECVTYRLGVHTTADDPTKYRSQEEVEAWERKDPLTRFTAYLEKRNIAVAGVEADVDAEIAAAVARFESAAPPDPLAMFDHAYGEPPATLEAQRAEVAARLRAERRPPAPPPTATSRRPCPCAASGRPDGA